MSRSEWKARPHSDGFEREAGGFLLGVTNQTYRNCGWCWHVSLIEPDRNGEIGEIAGGGGKETADDAKQSAELYVREFCQRSLSPDPVLAAIESLEQLTHATVLMANDAALGRLYHATHNWHLVVAAERMRRREAARAMPPMPDRAASAPSQERP